MLPDSIPESLWAEFRKSRKRIKAPMTEYAESLIIAKLERWRIEFGANPVDVLNEAIEKGWRGVFLNGHGKLGDGVRCTPSDKAQGFGVLKAGRNGGDVQFVSPQPVCSICGGNLDSGFTYHRGGKKCHNC